MTRGLTLVEVIVVVAIVLVLASLALGVFGSTSDEPRQARTEVLIRVLDAACERYKAETGAYPPDDRLHLHLGKERTLKLDVGTAVKRPPFLELGADQVDPTSSAVLDGWGRPVRYKAPGVKVVTHVDLWSAGSNGVDGDVDDVVNWKG